jgi:hypothetical protein
MPNSSTNVYSPAGAARRRQVAEDERRSHLWRRAWQIYGAGLAEVTEEYFRDEDTLPYTAEAFRFTKRAMPSKRLKLGWPSELVCWVTRSIPYSFGARSGEPVALNINKVEDNYGAL